MGKSLDKLVLLLVLAGVIDLALGNGGIGGLGLGAGTQLSTVLSYVAVGCVAAYIYLSYQKQNASGLLLVGAAILLVGGHYHSQLPAPQGDLWMYGAFAAGAAWLIVTFGAEARGALDDVFALAHKALDLAHKGLNAAQSGTNAVIDLAGVPSEETPEAAPAVVST